MIKLNKFEGIKGYATYENALKKLNKEVTDPMVQCFVSTSPEGRFIPVAVGHLALQNGLHFRGIVLVRQITVL